MAGVCDGIAGELGEVMQEGDVSGGSGREGESKGVEGLVDDIGMRAGDCCVPKKKEVL